MNKSYLVSRMSEPSTWRGIIMLLTAAGVQIQPQMIEVIVSCGMALAGLIGVVTADKKPDNIESNHQGD
jgi:hypothetical protein